jgi:arginase
MDLQIIAVPYDSGHRATRMGRGPEHLLHHGLEGRLRAAGHGVGVEVLEAEGFPAENATSFALYRQVGERVTRAVAQGRRPLVLSGNCGAVLGAIAGLGPRRCGLVWLDAHGDFNTPDITPSGFLDGMGMAVAVGRCWKGPASSIAGFRPLPEEAVAHVGGRDLDPEERTALEGSAIGVAGAAAIRRQGVDAVLGPVLARLRARVDGIYLHVDLDVLDPAFAPANTYAAPGGLTLEQGMEVVRAVRHGSPLLGMGLASYDPGCDPEGRARAAALGLIETAWASFDTPEGRA